MRETERTDASRDAERQRLALPRVARAARRAAAAAAAIVDDAREEHLLEVDDEARAHVGRHEAQRASRAAGRACST